MFGEPFRSESASHSPLRSISGAQPIAEHTLDEADVIEVDPYELGATLYKSLRDGEVLPTDFDDLLSSHPETEHVFREDLIEGFSFLTIKSQRWDASQHLALLKNISRSPKAQTILLAIAQEKLGPVHGARAVEEKMVLRLEELSEFAASETLDGKPLFKEHISFLKALSLLCIFGNSERLMTLARDNNIYSHLPDAYLNREKPIFKFRSATLAPNSIGEESSLNLTATIGLSQKVFMEKADEDANKEPLADVERAFSLSYPQGEQQEPHLSVTHEVLTLPASLQNKKLGKAILATSVRWYLEQGEHVSPSSIHLHANITVGGYAWAHYGFDWDKDRMISLRKVHSSSLSDEQIWQESLVAFCDSCASFGRQTLYESEKLEAGVTDEYTRERLRNLEKTLDELLSDAANPLRRSLVTPQRLAELGSEGPFFERVGSGWKVAKTNIPGPTCFHLGKIMLMDSSWYGRVSLRPTSTEEENNLDQLKKRLDI